MPRPVLLVHGIFDTGRVFDPMRRFLEKRGHAVHVLDLTPRGGKDRLDRLAAQVAAYADARLAGAFDLVGFSMGGLVSRYYVQRLGGAARVVRLVTLATPHHGSRLAHVLRRPACRQMRPGSAFLADLNATAEADLAGVEVHALWTPFDLMVVPARSSRFAVAEEGTFRVGLHRQMLTSGPVLRRVAEILEA
jgi:triacylglycerol lipase